MGQGEGLRLQGASGEGREASSGEFAGNAEEEVKCGNGVEGWYAGEGFVGKSVEVMLSISSIAVLEPN